MQRPQAPRELAAFLFFGDARDERPSDPSGCSGICNAAARNARFLQFERESGLRELVLHACCTQNLSRPCVMGRTVHRTCRMSRISPFGVMFPCEMSRRPSLRGSRSKSAETSMQNEQTIAVGVRLDRAACYGRLQETCVAHEVVVSTEVRATRDQVRLTLRRCACFRSARIYGHNQYSVQILSFSYRLI